MSKCQNTKYSRLKLSANGTAILPFWKRMMNKYRGYEYAILINNIQRTRFRRAYYVKGIWMCDGWSSADGKSILQEDMRVFGYNASSWLPVTTGLFDFVYHDNTKDKEKSTDGKVCRQQKVHP